MESFLSVLFSNDVPFLRYACIASLIASIPFGMMGSFVVVRRMSSMAGAVSHAIIGGVGLGVYLQIVWKWSWMSPTLGAMIASILVGLLIGWIFIRGKERLDTVLGAVWVIGMSLGLLLLTITPTYTDPMSYLFGNILLLTREDLWMMGILGSIVTTTTLFFYPQLQAVSFDEDFARIRGIAVSFLQLLLIVMVSLTVFLMLQVMGAVMVIALLTLPAAIASLFFHKLSRIIVVASSLVAFFSLFGLVLSYYLDLPTGALTVLSLAIVYLGSLLVKRVALKTS
ncbi:metal ABC transporter permease [Thermospira aquatica]|uniref:Metal ABC transporter permease n=1 Tax=Thermospira aquatica TaxID=2828656 RepID=A0AAX3BA77_9SPIR|nr:metal ABC transporter permease [Thermospira aquatica]URA09172.1 metal ABC transporter permease [Thermospira aquatica]